MPQLCSESEVQPSRRRARQAAARRRAQVQALTTEGLSLGSSEGGPPLSILDLPSPTLSDTCTTHNEMLFWVGWFARFHTEGSFYVPYEIKTLDCPAVRADGLSLLRSDGQPLMMRCLREIARYEGSGPVEWLMISWHIGVPGMTFQKCGSFDEAKAAFNAPPTPVFLP